MTWLLNNRFYSYSTRSINDSLTYYNLVIPNVQFKHAGLYVCLGHDEENHPFHGAGELLVKEGK